MAEEDSARQRSPGPSGYLIPSERLDSAILEIRGERVMVDYDLATVYGVSTKALNQAVKRNRDRFPEGFAFQLTEVEKDELVTNCDRLATLKALAAQFAKGGTEGLENPEVFRTPKVRQAGGLQALKVIGQPAEILRETKERLFAA